MVLQRVCAKRDRMETVLCNKQFDKLLHDVSYGGTHSHFGVGCGRKENGAKEGEVSEGVSLVMIQPFAWEKKPVL